MPADRSEAMVRRAIGGDAEAVAWIIGEAGTTDSASILVMAALLGSGSGPAVLDRARAVAFTSRDRQTVEIARAHLDGRAEQVDALARDHLVDHPGSLVVAWIAAGAAAAPAWPSETS